MSELDELTDNKEHQDAIGWLKIALCKKHFDDLAHCQQTRPGDPCTEEVSRIQGCLDNAEMEREAYMQLQYRSKHECPTEFHAFSNCMDKQGVGEKSRCSGLWVAMQLCSAKRVLNHVDQEKVRGSLWVPPSLVTPTVPGRG
mmetsp:Transcript_66539/g.138714  ORF Transcript_66539/g.138714 Transcript_66539/m.138714 type:complete len:142 (-) Transcript_66539:129-554(-)